MAKHQTINRVFQHIKMLVENNPNTPLPSVRKLSAMLHSSPVTILRALQQLKDSGFVISENRKGYFPAQFFNTLEKIEFPSSLSSRQSWQKISQQIEQDIVAGKFNPLQALPQAQELRHLYHVSHPTLQKALANLTKRSLIFREAQGYSLYPTGKKKLTRLPVIQVIMFSEDRQSPKLESEREQEFFSTLSREAMNLNVRLTFTSYNDYGSPPTFYHAQGQVSNPDTPETIGFLVATWHLKSYQNLIHQLADSGKPVSVWLEDQHLTKQQSKLFPLWIRFFDIGYGRQPGEAMAEHLSNENHQNIVYLSAFHQSQWSKQRLSGLKQQNTADSKPLDILELTQDNYRDIWDVREHLSESELLGVSSEYELLQRCDAVMLKELSPLIFKAINSNATAWVISNDHQARLVFTELKKNYPTVLRRIILAAFDGTQQAALLGIDSLSFPTADLVRQMIYHVLYPTSPAGPKPRVLHLKGKVKRGIRLTEK